MYRPEGWKNIYENHIHVAGNKELTEVIMKNKQLAFEAGADAMLKALRESTKASDVSKIMDVLEGKGIGTVVFLPDD